jgi:hypothetical protein
VGEGGDFGGWVEGDARGLTRGGLGVVGRRAWVDAFLAVGLEHAGVVLGFGEVQRPDLNGLGIRSFHKGKLMLNYIFILFGILRVGF